MAMNKPLFDIDQSGMQVAVNSYKPGNGLAWRTLFPLKFSPKFDLKGLEGNEGIPVSADRVAFNTKAPKKTRKTVGSWSGKLSKIAVSREKDEIEINEYNDLQTLAAANTEDAATARYLVDLVYDDLDFCNNAMDYKVEIDAMRIGSMVFRLSLQVSRAIWLQRTSSTSMYPRRTSSVLRSLGAMRKRLTA